MDITGLVNSGASIQDILSALQGDLTQTVEKSKAESKTMYEEAQEALQAFYSEAAQDRSSSFEDRYNILAEGMKNLGLPFEGDLANRWGSDQTFLTEAADNALATDLAWFEKMQANQNEIYNAILTELAAQVALSQVQGTGSPVGYSGGGDYSGGGNSGNSSEEEGEFDETTSLTNRSDYERDFPGFVEALQEAYAMELLNDNQWAHINDLLDLNTTPQAIGADLVKDIDDATLVANAANQLIQMIDSGFGGEVSQPLPVGDGTFQWQNVRVPQLSDFEKTEFDRYSSGERAFGLEHNVLNNPYVHTNKALADAHQIDRRVFDEYMAGNSRMLTNAGKTRDEADQLISDLSPLREYTRAYNPLFGWVNDSETAQEYFRTQKKDENQPAPSPIENAGFHQDNLDKRIQEQQNSIKEFWDQGGSYSTPQERVQNSLNRQNAEKFAAAREAEQRAAWNARAQQEAARKALAQKEAAKNQRDAERERWNNAGSYTPTKKKASSGGRRTVR